MLHQPNLTGSNTMADKRKFPRLADDGRLKYQIIIANTIRCDKRRNDDMYDIGCEFWWVGWKNNDIQKSLADYIIEQTRNSKNTACITACILDE